MEKYNYLNQDTWRGTENPRQGQWKPYIKSYNNDPYNDPYNESYAYPYDDPYNNESYDNVSYYDM